MTSVNPGRMLSTRWLTGLCGSCADRSFVVLRFFFGLEAAVSGMGLEFSSSSVVLVSTAFKLDTGFAGVARRRFPPGCSSDADLAVRALPWEAVAVARRGEWR